MVILDTCALIFDALTPGKLSRKAKHAIEDGELKNQLACSDISLWEVAMLIKKGRLDPGTDGLSFIKLMLSARGIRVLPINPEIAQLSVSCGDFAHHYPADRIIAATALHHKGMLITCDNHLRFVVGLKIVW